MWIHSIIYYDQSSSRVCCVLYCVFSFDYIQLRTMRMTTGIPLSFVSVDGFEDGPVVSVVSLPSSVCDVTFPVALRSNSIDVTVDATKAHLPLNLWRWQRTCCLVPRTFSPCRFKHLLDQSTSQFYDNYSFWHTSSSLAEIEEEHVGKYQAVPGDNGMEASSCVCFSLSLCLWLSVSASLVTRWTT